MCDVDRVWDVTQEFAKSIGVLPFHMTTGSHVYDEGKNENYDQSLIKSIHPQMSAAPDPGYGKDNYDQKTAPGESIFYMCELCGPGK